MLLKKKAVFLNIILLAMLVLSACGIETEESEGSNEAVRRIESATVVKKDEKTYFKAGSDYFITLEKEEQTLRLEVSETVYETVSEGLVISGDYKSLLENISYPTFEEK